jgi:light-regulated signal transduction histidine kinase (bacteriophytochrome)
VGSKNTPLIVLTALKSEEHLFRGYYMGAVDYLYKPIVPEVLKSKVAVFVDLSKKNALLKQHTEVLEQKNRELQQLITERTKAEEHVRLLNTELEERVQERTLELSRMNEELRQFAYVASHDLQEPLRTVGSYAQLLAKRYKGRLEPEADEFIHFMVDGVTRMHVLLNDMLAYSRVTDSSARPLKPVDLQGTLNGALMNLEASIKDTDAKVTCDKMPVVLADDVQLTQVFQNLISNAIKYRTAETPQVHVTAELDSSDWWKIGVADNGIGIDPKYHERVFGLFKRLHGKELPGTGMGLAICKKIVERHGGRIWIESDGSSSGSRFYFTLPPV